jgi:hypothetical protein
MSLNRSVLLSLMGVLLVSAAFSTASASATHAFIIEGTELGTTEGVQSESRFVKIELPIAKLPISVECTNSLSNGTLKAKGESTGEAELKGCYVFENNKGKKVFLTTCSVTEPVLARFNDLLIAHGVDELKEFKSEVKVNTCVLKGTYTVEGSEACAIPEAEFAKVIHSLNCTTAGSALKYKGTESFGVSLFDKEQVTLCTRKNWSST